MRKEQLVESIRQRDPLMAEAVDGMIDYVTENIRLHIRAGNRRKR